MFRPAFFFGIFIGDGEFGCVYLFYGLFGASIFASKTQSAKTISAAILTIGAETPVHFAPLHRDCVFLESIQY